MPTTPPNALLQGTLDLLILKTLSWGPRHGYAIARWVEQTTDDALQVQEGSLYPALYRLEDRGWIQSEWGISDEGRRVRMYTMTAVGKKQLTTEHAEWRRFVHAMELVLQGT